MRWTARSVIPTRVAMSRTRASGSSQTQSRTWAWFVRKVQVAMGRGPYRAGRQRESGNDRQRSCVGHLDQASGHAARDDALDLGDLDAATAWRGGARQGRDMFPCPGAAPLAGRGPARPLAVRRLKVTGDRDRIRDGGDARPHRAPWCRARRRWTGRVAWSGIGGVLLQRAGLRARSSVPVGSGCRPSASLPGSPHARRHRGSAGSRPGARRAPLAIDPTAAVYFQMKEMARQSSSVPACARSGGGAVARAAQGLRGPRSHRADHGPGRRGLSARLLVAPGGGAAARWTQMARRASWPFSSSGCTAASTRWWVETPRRPAPGSARRTRTCQPCP